MAFFTSCTDITAEIFLSEEPCAIALTFTPLRPRLPNILPLIPGWLFMLSPTSARIASSFSTIIGSTFFVSISYANISSIAFFASSAFAASIPTQIECSDEPCVIKITLICLVANASNNLFEKPGIPTMPLPSRLSKAILLMLEIPRIPFPFSVDSF